MRSIIWQLVLVAELLTAVFQGKELSPGQFLPPTSKIDNSQASKDQAES